MGIGFTSFDAGWRKSAGGGSPKAPTPYVPRVPAASPPARFGLLLQHEHVEGARHHRRTPTAAGRRTRTEDAHRPLPVDRPAARARSASATPCRNDSRPGTLCQRSLKSQGRRSQRHAVSTRRVVAGRLGRTSSGLQAQHGRVSSAGSGGLQRHFCEQPDSRSKLHHRSRVQWYVGRSGQCGKRTERDGRKRLALGCCLRKKHGKYRYSRRHLWKRNHCGPCRSWYANSDASDYQRHIADNRVHNRHQR